MSNAALQEVRNLVDNMSLRNQAQVLATEPEIYLRAGDEDRARKALGELVIMAGKLYRHDSDLGDPNQAFKGMWPSANLWRRCIEFAAKLTPSPAEEIIADIPDPEIKTFERAALAISLLGADSLPLSTMDKQEERYSRGHVPWRGREFCRGFEFSTTPFPIPRRATVANGNLFGQSTYRWLSARGIQKTRYLILMMNVPQDCNGVTRAEYKNGFVRVREKRKGRMLQVPVTKFL